MLQDTLQLLGKKEMLARLRCRARAGRVEGVGGSRRCGAAEAAAVRHHANCTCPKCLKCQPQSTRRCKAEDLRLHASMQTPRFGAELHPGPR
jgi:hypothetical protein